MITHCYSSQETDTADEVVSEMVSYFFLFFFISVVPAATPLTCKLAHPNWPTAQPAFISFTSLTNTVSLPLPHHQIEEQVLPQRYQQLITGEINRILRDMNKDPGNNEKNAARLVWRREYDYQSELEQTRMEIAKAEERAMEAQKRCDELELQASITEERFSDTIRKMSNTEVEEQVESPHDTVGSTHAALMEHVLASK